MVDASLTYVDATPLLQRAALTGDVTAAAGGNATTIKTSVALAGSPTTTTQAAADNSTKIATTAYVDTGLGTKAATSHTHAEADVTGLVADLALKAPVASPTFTGTPAAPTAAGGTSTTQVATTAFVGGEIATHAAAADPHTVYQKESEKGAVSGYVGINGAGYAEPTQLGNAGVPSAATYLNGTGTWATPASGSGNAVYATVDFGSAFTHSATVTVTGQAWVSGTSKIVANVLSASGKGIEDSLLSFSASVSDLVAATGFNLNVYTPVKAKGTYTFSCMGV
jgi:hypothetical protein